MMERSLKILLSFIMLAVSCQHNDVVVSEDPVVVLPDGPIVLQDTDFGMYYGDVNNDGMGLFSIVLSDARCYQDKLNSPYLDSEGDMLVIQIRTRLLEEDEQISLPAGEYSVSEDVVVNSIDASASYVKRQIGQMQSKWALESGVIDVVKEETGEYSITTRDLVISKDEVADTVEYVCHSMIKVADYLCEAPAMVGLTDDIINMPFADVECIYNGNLFGNGTGNFVVNMSTKGFVTEEGDVMDVPGIYLTLNFFSRLYSGNSQPVLEEGRYTVSTAASSSLMARWSILPGLYLDTTPFGSYVLQQPSEGEGTMEFIASGIVDVSYEDSTDVKAASRNMIMKYSFRTSSREISGEWRGNITVDDQSVGSTGSYLTTLDHDVECDMSKASQGTLALVEVLHRDNVKEEWDYDIAEAWQLWIEADPAYADGDAMVFEFVLPLGSEGDFAPELNKTYTYTMQPNLAEDDEMYEIYVSRMGRPHDEIFDPSYAEQNPGWADGIGITSYDRCNARRGFMYAGAVRGNWYIHYETGRYYVMDGHAPAVNGWVKVIRTDDDIYDFEWDFIDDNPGTPNRITGSIRNCKVIIRK